MPLFLGIDTSNYTTSAALYDSGRDLLLSEKKLLPVASGAAGLRQSDALFSHIRQLPDLLERLFSRARDEWAASGARHPDAVCASDRPRDLPDSYMPAFLAGNCAGSAVASALGIPLLHCSHQQGHIVAALHSAGAEELLRGSEPFYAFHVSGGTTECLLVTPGKPLFTTDLIARTLDLNAGQLIDRVGLMLGMQFPCGMELDRLSREWDEPLKPRPAFDGTDCHISGAQNQCEALVKKGAPAAHVARYAIEYIHAAVNGMTERVMQKYGQHPVVYAGGVMSNSLIRESLTVKYGGRFAAPEFSSDNAAGVAIIGHLLSEGG